MANDRIYPKGISVFTKHPNAPDFVIGTIIITPQAFNKWLVEDADKYTVDSNYGKQLKLQLTRLKDGKLSIAVDTWKPNGQSTGQSTARPTNTRYEDAEIIQDPTDDLPF